MERRTCRVIVLAAQRKGAVNPLARAHGVSHKCLAPLEGKPLIVHVLAAVAAFPEATEIVVCVEEEAFAAMREALDAAALSDARFRFVAAADNLADSVLAAARGHDGPFLVTTADNVLLGPTSLSAMLRRLGDCDAAVAFSPRKAVLAAHPDGQRRFYRFRDGAYSNCNLYGIANAGALGSVETFRGGGQFARRAGRVIEAFGLANLVLMRLGLLGLAQALRRVSRRIGLRIAPLVLSDGSQAIDVDNERTHAIAAQLLRERSGSSARAPRHLREVA